MKNKFVLTPDESITVSVFDDGPTPGFYYSFSLVRDGERFRTTISHAQFAEFIEGRHQSREVWIKDHIGE